MIKNARDCLFFTAMCLVTTSLSSLEMSLGTSGHERPKIPSMLDFLVKMVTKPKFWPVDCLGLGVTFHVSAFMAGVGVSLLAVLAKYKNVPSLFIPWLLFAFNGILENQAIHLVYNTGIIATASQLEPRVILFHLVVFVMLVEEARFWLAVFREFIAGNAHVPLVRWFSRCATPAAPAAPVTERPEVSTSDRQDAGDHLDGAGQTIGGDGGDKTVAAAANEQGDNLETGVTPEQEVNEDQSDIGEQPDEVGSEQVVEVETS